jgi:cytochrome P450
VTDLFTSSRRFLDLERWHREADALRSVSPVHLIDRSEDGFRPFWAVLSHAAVIEVERRPDVFTNEPDTFLARTADLQRQKAAGAAFRTLVQMDAPDHPKYRRLTADWFKPGRLGALQGRLDELSAQMMAKMDAFDGECDFATDIAVW